MNNPMEIVNGFWKNRFAKGTFLRTAEDYLRWLSANTGLQHSPCALYKLTGCFKANQITRTLLTVTISS